MQVWIITSEGLHLLHNGSVVKVDECPDVDCLAVNAYNIISYALDIKNQILL